MKTNWPKFISVFFGMGSAVTYIIFVTVIMMNRQLVIEADIAVVEPLLSIGIFNFLATILTYQRPENRISWLIFIIALMRQTGIARTLTNILFAQGVEPTFWLTWAGIIWNLLSGLMYGILAYIMVIFPTGRLPSRRWRLANWLLGLNGVITVGLILFVTYELYQFFSSATGFVGEISLVPLAPSGPYANGLHVRTIPELTYVTPILIVAVFMTLIMAIFSLTGRFRRGSFLVRQQIKWVLLAIAIWAAGLLLLLLPLKFPFEILIFIGPLPPIAITLAILRYRLFDIDLIIRRSLVYGLLTLVLAVVYFGSVALAQRLFTIFSGEDSPIIIVISTLIIVFLFAPLRKRIQEYIDRRFYRRKYNAEKILAQFSLTIRDEMELDRLTTEIIRVVEKTMQPEEVTIWIKDSS